MKLISFRLVETPFNYLSNPPKMNRPKTHHYIAQNHLGRFENDDGDLFYGIKETGEVICTSTANIMAKNELYSVELPTPPDTTDILYSSELESGFFSLIDSKWKSMCDEIVEIINEDKIPEIVGNTRQFLSQYIYNAHKRVPEVHQRSSVLSDPISSISDILDTELKNNPNRDSLTEIVKTPTALRRLVKNATAKAVATQTMPVIEYISASTFSWLVPRDTNSHFVIGSVPVVFIHGNETAQPDALKPSILFPISKDIYVEISRGGADGLYYISETVVGEINKRSVSQSRFCVGPNKKTIKSLFGMV